MDKQLLENKIKKGRATQKVVMKFINAKHSDSEYDLAVVRICLSYGKEEIHMTLQDRVRKDGNSTVFIVKFPEEEMARVYDMANLEEGQNEVDFIYDCCECFTSVGYNATVTAVGE